MGDPNYPQDPYQPPRPGDPEFGRPVDPRFNQNPELGQDITQQVGRPLTVWDSVLQAFSLYRADLFKLWAVTAVIAIPFAILLFVVRDSALPGGTTLQNGNLYLTSLNTSATTYNLVSALGQLVQSLILLIATGATYRILLGRRLNHPATLGAAFSFAVERAPKLLLLSICVVLAVVVGFICIIVPGIYLLIAYTLAVPVLMAEDLGVFGSMSRSMELVRDCWWHVLGAVFVLAIIVGILDVVLQAVIAHAVVHSSHSPITLLIVSEALQAVFLVVISPLTAALSTVLYVDMLLRKRDPHLARLLA